VLISIEMTSLREYVIEEIKSIVMNQLDISNEEIWVTVTHTFSVPHTRSEEALAKGDMKVIEQNKLLCQSIYDAVSKAVGQLEARLEPVKIGFGNAFSTVNVNRDVETAAGWWLGANDMGISDHCVPIIKIENSSGKVLGILYSFDVQSSIMEGAKNDAGVLEITSDLVGMTSQTIEQQINGSVALFLLGTAGDQAPLFKASHNLVNVNGNIMIENVNLNGYVLENALGKKLADSVLHASLRINCTTILGNLLHNESQITLPGQLLPTNMHDLQPTRNYQFKVAPPVTQPIKILAFGNMVFVAVQPELSSLTGMAIKKASPFPFTMVMTMVDGLAKYLVDQSGYDRMTYEAMNSMFASGAAEKMAEKIIRSLHTIWKERMQ
jgi:hypothetical protein